MLIAIGALVLIVVFLANKPMPGDQQLPNPPSIPATGTTGVPSPATMPNSHGFGSPLLGTNAGQLVMGTNAAVPAAAWRGNPPLPSPGVVSSTPTSVPLMSKELFTGVRTVQPLRTAPLLPTGFSKL